MKKKNIIKKKDTGSGIENPKLNKLEVFLCALVFLIAGVLIVRMFYIVENHQELADELNGGCYYVEELESQRGSIYDTNGALLAQSKVSYKLYVDYVMYAEAREELLETLEKCKAEAGSDSNVIIYDYGEIEEKTFQYIAEKLEITVQEIYDACYTEDGNRYHVIKEEIDSSTIEEIEAYLTKFPVGKSNTISDDGKNTLEDKVWNMYSFFSTEFEEGRIYPQNELAASVIGFVNSAGNGIYGVESYYNEELTGTDGKRTYAKDAKGNEMYYGNGVTYEAQNGNSLYLTLDSTIQTYVEAALADMTETFQVANQSCAIVMNAKTGAILAMGTSGGFDLNNPYVISDESKSEELSFLKKTNTEEYKEKYTEYSELQWKNKTVSDSYFPGSVFKVITSSGALEEDIISTSDYLNCSGCVTVNGIDIHCWNRYSGHGIQSFTDALTNSCNPAFIEIGLRMGADLFYKYYQSFGFTAKTGIDLPGEIVGNYATQKRLENDLTLAACSYGQTNTVTPIQMLSAYAAVVNDGKLMQPYVVEKIVDENGNTVSQHEDTLIRQVVSKETSDEMKTALKAVVENNGGSNAYIMGYSIGGKSGTSQKLVTGQAEEDCEYVASYVCFAPAEDPEIIMLVMADEPNKNIDYYGSVVAVPYARKLMEKILPYLGYYPEYTEEQQASLNITMPSVENISVELATEKLEELELNVSVVGSGTAVYGQYPPEGETLSKGNTVYLYTESGFEYEKTTVPAVLNMKFTEAQKYLSQAGLNYITSGASSSRSDAIVQTQSLESGQEVEKGSVVELELVINDQTG